MPLCNRSRSGRSLVDDQNVRVPVSLTNLSPALKFKKKTNLSPTTYVRVGDGHTAGAAMVHDPEDVVEAEIDDRITELPDDVLLDILGRLAEAGDVRAVARTSILSRRWRSLPWPEIPRVSLDVERFLHPDVQVQSPWRHVQRRCRLPIWLQNQRRVTAGLTDALARFLAAPPSRRVIDTLSLKFILTTRGHERRIGELVGAAAGTGTVKNVDVELLIAEAGGVALTPEEEERTKLGYGERFVHFLQGCPATFRSLTKLTLHDLWFHDPAELNGLVRRCNALVFLSLSSCALLPVPPVGVGGDDVEEPPRRPPLSIDAPESRLQTLLCDLCRIGGVELVRAPELVGLRYRAIVFEDSPPVSFGCTPSLKGLHLGHYQDEGAIVKLKLSELLVNGGGQLERLLLAFQNGEVLPLCTPPYSTQAQIQISNTSTVYIFRTLGTGVLQEWYEISLSSSPHVWLLLTSVADMVAARTPQAAQTCTQRAQESDSDRNHSWM